MATETSVEVIDRIMAVVLQQPILLSDVNAVLSLQLVEVPRGHARIASPSRSTGWSSER